MSEVLSRNLQEVVDRRFGGSYVQAAFAAGLSQDAIRRIIRNPNYMPELPTLRAIAETYGWGLAEVCYWALGIEEAPPEAPAVELARALRRLGLPPEAQASLCQLAYQLAEPTGADVPGRQ